MKIAEYVSTALIPELRRLWKIAFGDGDAFLDIFFSTAYAPERCRCITEGDRVLAALYWFDIRCEGRKLAYIYAVATDPACRNRGLCRRLMDNTLQVLTDRGYDGAMLVPVTQDLIGMYEKMGFVPCSTVSEFWCGPQIPAAPIHKVDSETWALARKALLPPGAVLQEGENLALLESLATFYTGPGFAAAVAEEEGKLRCLELLGDVDAAPHILMALGYDCGFFRCPGKGKPFAMLSLLTQDCPKPTYLGFSFD